MTAGSLSAPIYLERMWSQVAAPELPGDRRRLGRLNGGRRLTKGRPHRGNLGRCPHAARTPPLTRMDKFEGRLESPAKSSKQQAATVDPWGRMLLSVDLRDGHVRDSKHAPLEFKCLLALMNIQGECGRTGRKGCRPIRQR